MLCLLDRSSSPKGQKAVQNGQRREEATDKNLSEFCLRASTCSGVGLAGPCTGECPRVEAPHHNAEGCGGGAARGAGQVLRSFTAIFAYGKLRRSFH